ncbi:MAG: hypothetical protein IPH20_16445 [Bacteroidales bacterium]|nr:hypothetical protein [Bacteroidales bacterium]
MAHYSVTITDANGCTATSSATVNNIGGPAASISAQTNVACNGAFTEVPQFWPRNITFHLSVE